ncbi:MAG: non-canonical purine NTP pyrophosphatase, partial [Planctomycetota bacterium]|nr:non-canonical purine NTP pyrophosphatase [Planctomycetota bacterium]
RKKAAAGARASGLWTLADDSGLEVDHLGGAPGVRSARYAGANQDEAANNARLLRELEGVPESRRGARFVSALALARPDGIVALEIRGTARGRMLDAARGSSGFGYDPLFLFTEEGFAQSGRTFAELDLEEKAAVSHRGRAMDELLARLPDVLAGAV